jgi:tRNA-modifying protein YgfZ
MTSATLSQQQHAMGGVPLDSTEATPRIYRFCRPDVLHFGDAAAEYRAATAGAAVFDVSDRRQLELTGKDCRSFLHNFCTNDIKRLQAGQGCEALMTNAKGRILAHICVFATDASLWVEAGPGDDAPLIDHFEHYLFREDVQVTARTAQYGELLLSGAESSGLLARACAGVRSLGPLEHVMSEHAGRPLVVRRVDLLHDVGYLLSIDRTWLVDLWTDLVSQGARPGGAEAFHAARIEAGWPLYGLDLSHDNLAQEAARTARAISFTKGCYLGQEPIARIDSHGHINRQLCRLRIDADIAPEPDAAVRTPEGDEIGAVTSAVRIPGQARSVALACLRVSHSQPGTPVELIIDGRKVAARVDDQG